MKKSGKLSPLTLALSGRWHLLSMYMYINLLKSTCRVSQHGKSKNEDSTKTFLLQKLIFRSFSWHHINWSLVSLGMLRTLETNFSSTWALTSFWIWFTRSSCCLLNLFTMQFPILNMSLSFLSFCITWKLLIIISRLHIMISVNFGDLENIPSDNRFEYLLTALNLQGLGD